MVLKATKAIASLFANLLMSYNVHIWCVMRNRLYNMGWPVVWPRGLNYGLNKPTKSIIVKRFDSCEPPGIVEIRLVSAKFMAGFTFGLATPWRGHGMVTTRYATC